jgi:8-oxo-dGTP pyrophosphatase MutT (NUDIX family)
MKKESTPCYATGGVIYRRNTHGAIEVLLIKKEHGGWSLPKGHIKAGENDLEALRREVAEETALTGTIEVFLHEVTYPVVKRRQTRQKNVRYYLIHSAHGTPRPGKQERIRTVRWFCLMAAIKRAHNERVRTVLEHARASLNNNYCNLDPWSSQCASSDIDSDRSITTTCAAHAEL